MKEALEALVAANQAVQKSLVALGSVMHSQAKQIKALEDRVKMLEEKNDRDTLATDTGDSDD